MTKLSDQETAVLGLAANGYTDKQIAVALFLSLTTVRTYWSRIKTKTGGANRTHATCLGLHLAIPRLQNGPDRREP